MSTTYPAWKRHRACDRKRPFYCQLDANRAVLEQMRDGKNLTTYVCDYCGLIHLTKDDEEKTA